jgi:hypothetical protein
MEAISQCVVTAGREDDLPVSPSGGAGVILDAYAEHDEQRGGGGGNEGHLVGRKVHRGRRCITAATNKWGARYEERGRGKSAEDLEGKHLGIYFVCLKE